MSKLRELYDAISAEDVTRIERLLTENPDLANCKDYTPPPIHTAVYENKLKSVEALLDHGADIELRDQDRNTTPVRWAIVYARQEIIRLLVSRGAYLGSRNLSGTALQVALEGAEGGMEDFPELPTRDEYRKIAALLRDLGAEATE